MPTNQLTNNASIQHSIRRRRDLFVEQLRRRESELLQLTSLACGKGPCDFFKPNASGSHFTRGSYNVSFFIQFADGQRCTARDVSSRAKSLPCSIYHRTRQCPIPKIIAYRADEGVDPLMTFLILEFIDGRHISLGQLEAGLPPHEKRNLFESLADMHIQLRRQEFPAIGRLEASTSTSTPQVGQRMVSIEMNTLQLEGLPCFSIQDTYNNEDGVLKSATAYADMQLCIGYAAFLNSPNGVEQAKEWIDPALDQGPFILVHGYLHPSNLILDKDARIIGVLDWEWSRVVPLQYFTPPTWLSGRDTALLALPVAWSNFLTAALADFLAIVETREMAMYGNLKLHSEWSRTVAHAEPLVANAVQNWTDVDWFVHRYIYNKQPFSDDDARAFADEDPSRALLAQIKEHDAAQYEKELVRLEEMDEKLAKVDGSTVLILLEKIRHMRQHAGASILGWSVAACLVIAAIWRRA